MMFEKRNQETRIYICTHNTLHQVGVPTIRMTPIGSSSTRRYTTTDRHPGTAWPQAWEATSASLAWEIQCMTLSAGAVTAGLPCRRVNWLAACIRALAPSGYGTIPNQPRRDGNIATLGWTGCICVCQWQGLFLWLRPNFLAPRLPTRNCCLLRAGGLLPKVPCNVVPATPKPGQFPSLIRLSAAVVHCRRFGIVTQSDLRLSPSTRAT
jgi:hypothetical protein